MKIRSLIRVAAGKRRQSDQQRDKNRAGQGYVTRQRRGDFDAEATRGRAVPDGRRAVDRAMNRGHDRRCDRRHALVAAMWPRPCRRLRACCARCARANAPCTAARARRLARCPTQPRPHACAIDAAPRPRSRRAGRRFAPIRRPAHAHRRACTAPCSDARASPVAPRQCCAPAAWRLPRATTACTRSRHAATRARHRRQVSPQVHVPASLGRAGKEPARPQHQHDQEGEVPGQDLPLGIDLGAHRLGDADDDAAGQRAPEAARARR